ncbi:MAG: membrane protein insertase YidC [Polynucleobacter sp.]|nr:membrane protein insertase YidC [Polynucleobacter sp.]
MDIKKTLLWVIFSMACLMLYNNWLLHAGRPTLFGTTGAQQAEPKDTALTTTPKNDLPAQVSANSISKTPSQVIASPTNIAGEKFNLRNDVLSVDISSAGGSVVGATLLTALDHNKNPIVLFRTDLKNQYFARSGLISSSTSDLPNHTVLFALVKNNKSENGSQELTLSSEKGGIRLDKTFILKKGSYELLVEHKITQAASKGEAPNVVLYTEIVRDGNTPTAHSGEKPSTAENFYSTFTGPSFYTEKDKFVKVEFSELEKNKFIPPKAAPTGEPAWIAMVQHYFASAWIPNDKIARDIYAGKLEQNLYRIGMQMPIPALTPNAPYLEKTRLFMGPQEEKLLEKIAPGFDLIKDYGYLTVLAKPIFWLLEKINVYVSNWGWSIVLLTVLIKLVFFPLSAASYKSMARMKEVQPRLMAMREQYKGDPQKLNQAMMEMYKKEKINPLGGCLPVVVQIPVFIALYWVLLSSVEMRNAPWIGWIHDLSSPDVFFGTIPGIDMPIGILPIVMAISMFIQTKLNPTPPDPIQAKVMLYMPIIFSAMFFFFPSGLVLYWVVNNILSIAQQWQINKMFGKSQKK